jgi:Xaa-Pro aminopeptidase
MSGGSGYGYGYGAGQPGASRYDTGDSGYGNGNTGGNGYNDRGPGSTGGGAGGDRRGNHDRRPGGYGGFYPESTQQPSLAPPGPPSPERRRDRADRDRQQQPAQSTSRSRTRNGEADRRYQGPREDRTREAPRYQENRSREPVPDTMVMQSNTAEMRSVEGSSGLMSAFSLAAICYQWSCVY